MDELVKRANRWPSVTWTFKAMLQRLIFLLAICQSEDQKNKISNVCSDKMKYNALLDALQDQEVDDWHMKIMKAWCWSPDFQEPNAHTTKNVVKRDMRFFLDCPACATIQWPGIC